MSLSIENKVTLNVARAVDLASKRSAQVSFADITDATFTVTDQLVVFVNRGDGCALTLPAPTVGRNLFVVNRVAGAGTVTVPAGVYIDIEADANGSTTQTGLLPATSGSWVHLLGNGSYWVAVAKPVVAP